MIWRWIDKQLLKYLVAFYSLLVLISMAKKIYFKSQGIRYSSMDWWTLLVYNIFWDWVLVILFMVIVSYLVQLMYARWGAHRWRRILAVHLLLSFVIGYFIFFSVSLIGLLSGSLTTESISYTLSFLHFLDTVELNFLIYFSMVGIIHVYYYVKQVKNMQLQQSRLETHLATSQLESLKAQLQPHFIFNTLNSISSLIEEDKERSQDLLADFADLLREILDQSQRQLISLEEELRILDKYMDIIAVRFSDHLSYHKTVDQRALSYPLPQMILQPLVENAVKHGYGEGHTSLTISLSIVREAEGLHIRIYNDGRPLAGDPERLMSQGTGLRNTRERLRARYGAGHSFTMRNADEGGVVIELRLLGEGES